MTDPLLRPDGQPEPLRERLTVVALYALVAFGVLDVLVALLVGLRWWRWPVLDERGGLVLVLAMMALDFRKRWLDERAANRWLENVSRFQRRRGGPRG